jgi:hypothetical protein
LDNVKANDGNTLLIYLFLIEWGKSITIYNHGKNMWYK